MIVLCWCSHTNNLSACVLTRGLRDMDRFLISRVQDVKNTYKRHIPLICIVKQLHQTYNQMSTTGYLQSIRTTCKRKSYHGPSLDNHCTVKMVGLEARLTCSMSFLLNLSRLQSEERNVWKGVTCMSNGSVAYHTVVDGIHGQEHNKWSNNAKSLSTLTTSHPSLSLFPSRFIPVPVRVSVGLKWEFAAYAQHIKK